MCIACGTFPRVFQQLSHMCDTCVIYVCYMTSCTTPVIHLSVVFRCMTCVQIQVYYMCGRYMCNIHVLHM